MVALRITTYYCFVLRFWSSFIIHYCRLKLSYVFNWLQLYCTKNNHGQVDHHKCNMLINISPLKRTKTIIDQTIYIRILCYIEHWDFHNRFYKAPVFWFFTGLVHITKRDKTKNSLILLNVCLMNYSCNKITTTQIQISRQNWNGFFSNISRWWFN